MKTTTLTVALLLVVATAFATEKNNPNSSTDTKVALVKKSAKHYKLVYLDKTSAKVKLSVKNEDGVTVYSETVKNKRGFSKPFNLEELPAGDYTFSVKSENEEILEEKVTIKDANKKIGFSADVLKVNENKKFRLAVINDNKAELPITVKIYDADGSLLYKDTIENLYGFNRKYDLKKAYGDSFTFNISNGETSESIDIR